MKSHQCVGVGLGFRPSLSGALLQGRLAVDFLEVVAESCLQAAARREVAALGRMWPLALHGVKLSLGSAEGLNMRRARHFAAVAREIGASVVSEHISFVRAGGREIGHLTPLPYTDEAVEAVARNARTLQSMVDVPLLLENVAWTLRWPEDAMSEGEFLGRVLEAAGCDMLLDVGNLYANAVNAGLDPAAVLATFPLHRVRMLHVAGGVVEGGFYYDTHQHPVPEAVFGLVERLGDVPVLLERDEAFEDVEAIGRELDRMRGSRLTVEGMWPGSSLTAEGSRLTVEGNRLALEGSGLTVKGLVARQALLARILTSDLADVAPFDATDIARSRRQLLHKRVDDALPLLPELGRGAEALALDCLRGQPRAERYGAFCDAWAIARAASRDPELCARAEADLLTLRARFVHRGDGLRLRLWPYVGRSGRVLVAKGFGAEAPVRRWRIGR